LNFDKLVGKLARVLPSFKRPLLMVDMYDISIELYPV